MLGWKLGKGSMTVEAAFVVPMTLIVIYLIISLTLQIFERSWDTALACEQAILLEETKIRPVNWIRKIQAAEAWKGVIDGS